MKRKILYICLMLLIVTGIFKTAYAATVSISAKTSATVGIK